MESPWSSRRIFCLGSSVSWNSWLFPLDVFCPLVLMEHFLKEVPGRDAWRGRAVRARVSRSAVLCPHTRVRVRAPFCPSHLPALLLKAFYVTVFSPLKLGGFSVKFRTPSTVMSSEFVFIWCLTHTLGSFIWKFSFFNAGHFSWLIALLSSYSLFLSRIKLSNLLA